MNDIKRPSGDNLGGLIKFKFVPMNDVQSIDTAINGKVTTEVTLKEGAQWYCGYCTLGTMGFTEPSAKSPNGEVFQAAFTGVCPQDKEENNDLFNEMRNQKFIIDITDSNGLRKLVGGIDAGLFFSSSLNTQTDMAGRNAHAISFYGDMAHKAYIYDI